MNLLLDIGNSTIVVAVVDKEGNISLTWRFKTKKDESGAYFRHELYIGEKKFGIKLAEIERVIISSVVPEVNGDVAKAINDLTGVIPEFFSFKTAKHLMRIDIESPSQLGNDRLADAIGAVKTYGTPAITIDMGTATTFGVINKEGAFIGGLIAPGVKTSLNALSARASQLPSINLEEPKRVVGRNTTECMQSGILFGTASLIDGIIDRILEATGETTETMHVIATGGIAKYIVPHCKHDITFDGTLQFKGLLAL